MVSELETVMRKILPPPECLRRKEPDTPCLKCCWYCNNLPECVVNWRHPYDEEMKMYFWCKELQKVRWCSIVFDAYNKIKKEWYE